MTFTSLLCLKFTSCCRYIKIVRSCFDIIPKQNLYEPILDHCGSNYNQLWRKVIEHFAKQNDFEKCYKKWCIRNFRSYGFRCRLLYIWISKNLFLFSLHATMKNCDYLIKRTLSLRKSEKCIELPWTNWNTLCHT